MAAGETAEGARARLFVALALPDEIRDAIVAWQGGALDDPALRAVRPEALHFTLAFLGSLPESEIDAVAAALPEGLPAPRLRLSPTPVAVPRGGRPRLFAIEAESEGAVEVQAEVASALQRAGFYEPEKRPFWPHLTVARVRSEGKGSRRSRRVEKPPPPLPPACEHPFASVRMQLYRSYLRPQGAEYVSLASLELNPDS
jgi:2'-5' RNA ligase